MSSILTKLTALYLILTPLVAHAASAERMKGDLDSIVNTMKNQYALLDFKKELFGVSIDDQADLAKSRIDAISGITQKDFHVILKDFFSSFRDYHTNVHFYSTEMARLPFHIREMEGEYFVSFVDESKMPPTWSGLFLGDQILSFDGVPIADAVLSMIPESIRDSYTKTDLNMACLKLTSRAGARGEFVPQGPVTIKFKSPFFYETSYQQFIWDYTPETFTNWIKFEEEPEYKTVLHEIVESKKTISAHQPFFDELRVKGGIPNDIPGARESYVPPLGLIWWESDPNSPFHAYIYENEDGERIGYLRIPAYQSSDEAINQLFNVITLFEERTDALVIDQINNPGGDLFFCYTLASLLTQDCLETPRHRQAITQRDVSLALYFLEEFEHIDDNESAVAAFGPLFYGFQVNYQFVQYWKDWARFIVDQWSQGKTFTDPYYLYGCDLIPPNPYITYSKPILILINEMDFSCGDFFPAIMQDNKRAKLLGAKTSGAGGYILPVSFPNLSGISSFSVTGSLATRPDGSYLENYGVTPDYECELSIYDLFDNYSDYRCTINGAIDDLMWGYEEDHEDDDFWDIFWPLFNDD